MSVSINMTVGCGMRIGYAIPSSAQDEHKQMRRRVAIVFKSRNPRRAKASLLLTYWYLSPSG
jgi:hypothetical protein